MTEPQLAWLAGLLEGEGSFVVTRVRRTDRPTEQVRVRISVQMTDEDVVQRVRQVVGLGNVWPVSRQKQHHKDSYLWAITSRSCVAELLNRLRPHMGERRRGQIDACLAAAKEASERPQRQRRHGHSKYKIDGCRCTVCYSAKSAANARRVRRSAAVV